MPDPDYMKLEGPLAREGWRAFQAGEPRPRRPPRRLWFVIADEGKTLIYRWWNGNAQYIGKAFPDIPYEKEQDNDFIGRGHRRANSHNRHGLEPHYRSERHEEELFLRSLAAYLEQGLNEDAYDELILIAAPQTLGLLRQVLPEQVQEHIRDSCDRDLVNMPEEQLEQELKALILPAG